MTQIRNVVVVVLDTARATDALGGSPPVMPTLSELADTGTQFTRAFTTAPWSLPAHASLFTGRYPSNHNAHGGHTYLSTDQPTLPATLGSSGFETVGISNNTWITDEFGFARGFETFKRGWQYVQSETDLGVVAHELDSLGKLRTAIERMGAGNPLVNLLNLWYAHRRADDGASHTTRRIERWLQDRETTRPFFLFANFLEPHLPYEPPPDHARTHLPPDVSYSDAMNIRQDPRAHDVGKYSLSSADASALQGLYRGSLATVDEYLGRLRGALVAADVWDETLLVVAGDHGENIGDHGFLGHQYNVYDTLLHVPLVIHGGPFTDGGTVDRPVSLADVAPTILATLGQEETALASQSDGASLSPLADAGREHVLAEYIAPQPSVDRLAERFGELPAHVHDYDRSLRALRSEDWKLITGSDGLVELYHVASDPGETTDLAETEPAQVAAMQRALDDRVDEIDTGALDEGQTVTGATAERLASLGYM